MNMSMTERIKAGKLFTDMCEGLPEKRLRGKTLMYEFNHSHPSEFEKRESLIKEMFATVGENAWVDPISANLRVEPSEECDASVPR